MQTFSDLVPNSEKGFVLQDNSLSPLDDDKVFA